MTITLRTDDDVYFVGGGFCPSTTYDLHRRRYPLSQVFEKSRNSTPAHVNCSKETCITRQLDKALYLKTSYYYQSIYLHANGFIHRMILDGGNVMQLSA